VDVTGGVNGAAPGTPFIKGGVTRGPDGGGTKGCILGPRPGAGGTKLPLGFCPF
jgi:hypothetical protein